MADANLKTETILFSKTAQTIVQIHAEWDAGQSALLETLETLAKHRENAAGYAFEDAANDVNAGLLEARQSMEQLLNNANAVLQSLEKADRQR